MSEDKKLQTEVKSRMDLVVSKEDVLDVLMCEQEETYKEELEEIRQKMDAVIPAKAAAHNASLEIVAKQGDVTLEELGDVNIFLNQSYRNNNNDKGYTISMYDMDRLDGIKRPDLARNKKKACEYYDNYLKDTVSAVRHIKTKDGFEGTLKKDIVIKATPELKAELKKYNEARKKGYELEAEESEVLYKILVMHHDKKIKAGFIKNIVKTSDYSKTLLSIGE